MEVGKVKNLFRVATFLCKIQNVRHAGGQTVSKERKWRKTRNKKEIGAKFPLPEISGEVLFGIHPVQAALCAGKRQSYAAFFKAGVYNDRVNIVRRMCEERQVDMLDVTGPVLDSLSGNHPHQGVCLDVSPLEHRSISIDVDITSENLLNSKGDASVWMLPYRVKDTMNMGAVLRSAQYFGVDRVVVPVHYSSALNPVVSKASAGALELMDILSLKNESSVTQCLQRWRDAGGIVVGSTSDKSHEKAVYLHKYTTEKPTMLILGSEDEGIGENISSYCDILLCIQNYQTAQHGEQRFCVDSLNVSVATGVLLHSVMMNRNRK